MSIILSVSVPHQSHIGVKTIEIASSECTIAEIKKKIADMFEIDTAGITKIELEVNPAKIKEVTNLEDLTLQDFNVTSSSCKFKIHTKDKLEIQSKAHKERIGLFEEIHNTKMRIAQNGLTNALKQAQIEGAHVIITVGSYLSKVRDEDSLIRQQFPIDRLKHTTEDQKVHLIHIDPAFNTSDNAAAQYHDGPGWKMLTQDKNELVKSYFKDNYKITTIAHAIADAEEGDAYFKAIGHPQNILNIDLGPYIQAAVEEGRGFIAGNFYEKTAEPIIAVDPAIVSELEKHGNIK